MDARRALLGVRQYQASGQRAPHKPLLILLALAHLERSGTSRLEWSTVERELKSLLDEYGVPKRGAQLPSYPFTRLRADGIWELSADVPDDDVRPLREKQVFGQFTAVIESQLRQDPSLIPSLAREIVDAQFTASIADDVLTAVGFDPEATRSSVVPDQGAFARRRSPEWRRQVLLAWSNACAFCGFDGSLGSAAVGIEAAHVRWFNFGGPDDMDNGLALCSLHHKLFDRGALGLEGIRIVVSSDFTANSAEGRRTYDLHGTELRPRPGTRMPAESHVEWHTTQVFKGTSFLD